MRDEAFSTTPSHYSFHRHLKGPKHYLLQRHLFKASKVVGAKKIGEASSATPSHYSLHLHLQSPRQVPQATLQLLHYRLDQRKSSSELQATALRLSRSFCHSMAPSLNSRLRVYRMVY